jgi:hypothetical protein
MSSQSTVLRRFGHSGGTAHDDVPFHAETETLPWRTAEWGAVMLGLCWLFLRSYSLGAVESRPAKRCDAHRKYE